MTFEEWWSHGEREHRWLHPDVRKYAARAFVAGQEAMREKAAQVVEDTPRLMAGELDDRIRALTIE